VRANLTLYGLRGEDLRVIAITSASPGEGKTTLTANLALAVASSGRSVLVISADLRLPSLHRFFDENPTGAGLLEVLAGDMPLAEATATPSLNGAGAGGGRLHVLANARRFRDPAPLFESQAMLTLLDEARNSYDYVLIDSPPVLGAPEASIVARLADGAIVVGRAGTLSREDVRHTLLRLEHAGVRPLGVVVSGVTSTREAYGYGLTA
jgi:capsular exopolysaccharide synthesis family protein